MRRIATILAAIVMAATSAAAQVYHQFPGAPVTAGGQVNVGPYLAFGDNLFRLGGYGRFNLNRRMDVGLEVVFDHDGGWRGGAGADVKYLLAPTTFQMPFELAFDGGIGLDTGNHLTTVLFPLGAIVSRTVALQSGKELTPFGGVYLVIFHKSFSGVKAADKTSTDVELRLGASFRFLSATEGLVALHLGMGTKLYIGMVRGL